MANHISHASLPYPIKNARYTVLVPYLDADGDPLDPTTPDTEVSQDGGAFADAVEEVTTITGSNGMGFMTLSGAETNNSAVGLAFKVASGPKATLMTVYPRVLPILESGTAQAGAAGTITLASGAAAYDLSGAIVRTTGGTGGGGAGGANNQARVITAYNTSTKVATVVPNWETTPDGTTTYDVLVTDLMVNAAITRGLRPATDGRTAVVDAAGLVDANAVKLGPTGAGTAQTARDVGASVLLSTGTGTGQLDFTSGVVKSNLVQILATALTETVGLLAGGFKKFFNVAAPTGTVNSLPDAVAGAAGGVAIVGSAMALTAAAVDDVHDEAVDGIRTFRQSMRLANSANGGKLAGAATATVTIRDLADTKDRVTATVDADGNRSAVTLDLT